MEKKPKTATIDGITFDIPDEEFLCEECDTINNFNDDEELKPFRDNPPPFHCDNCGAKLKYTRPELPIKGDLDVLA